MTEFDRIPENYDQSRGGEQRGAEYAADLDACLPEGDGPIPEIGVGTGVVALGLRRRGRSVLGVDLSTPMLGRAHSRLGPVVVLSDAMNMALGTASVPHAVSVWVVHSVANPVLLFREAARVIRPGGRSIVCVAQRSSPDDRVGAIMEEMGVRVDVFRGVSRPRGVSVEEVLEWAESAGFTGNVHQLERQWRSSTGQELRAIANRTWPALWELDEDALEEVTRPAVDALRAFACHRSHSTGDSGDGRSSTPLKTMFGPRSPERRWRPTAVCHLVMQ